MRSNGTYFFLGPIFFYLFRNTGLIFVNIGNIHHLAADGDLSSLNKSLAWIANDGISLYAEENLQRNLEWSKKGIESAGNLSIKINSAITLD